MARNPVNSANAWDALTAAAVAHQPLTYSELGDRIGLHRRSLKHCLGEIQDYCLEQNFPPLTIIVGRQDGSGPSTGFFASDQAHMASDQEAVWAFDWKQLSNPFRKTDADLRNEKGTLAERARRVSLWEALSSTKPENITPKLLRELRVFGGAQGIWVDKTRTSLITPMCPGAAVSVFHSGSHYVDDLTEDGVIFHYPNTDRGAARDAAEVEALKWSRRLDLPIFVILLGKPATLRSVKLAWVADWDDDSKQALILFGEIEPNYAPPPAIEDPFNLTSTQTAKYSRVKMRPGQQKFRFQVLKQYGAKCAVCGITHSDLIQAAHLRGKAQHGSDDWRNGLPLCPTHHYAFDSDLFCIEPQTMAIKARKDVNLTELGISRPSLVLIRNTPHQDALRWRFEEAHKKWDSQ